MFKFLGVTITNNLSWTTHVNETFKMAQQRLFFLRRLMKFGMTIRTLTKFNNKSILSGCSMAWYGNCSAQDCEKLQKIVNIAQTITLSRIAMGNAELQ
eukprot:g41372.t1